MSEALTRGSIEQLRGLLADEDEWTKPVIEDINTLCDMALRSLGTPSGEQEPVAWRYRYGATGMWKYAGKAEDCNPGPEYEREPLYGHPWEQPSGTVQVPVEPTREMLMAGKQIWLGARSLEDYVIAIYRAMLAAAQKDGKC